MNNDTRLVNDISVMSNNTRILSSLSASESPAYLSDKTIFSCISPDQTNTGDNKNQLRQIVNGLNDQQKKILEDEYKETEKKMDQVIIALKKRLSAALRQGEFDSDSTFPAERVTIDIVNKYSFQTLGIIMQDIYITQNDAPNILVGLCKCLMRYDASDVFPWGQTMLIGLLTHENDLVIAAAAELVDNFADRSLLSVLMNTKVSTPWLASYVQSVIDYLEGSD